MQIYCSYRCAATQHHCTATLLFAKCSLHCSVLLCKLGLQQACITANTPVKICFSYRCAVTQNQCTAAVYRPKCTPHCSVLLCKTGLQQACIIETTPMQICCSYRCAVTQHQCTATLFFAKCPPHSCKMLSIQVCDVATPMHCNTGSGQNSFPAVKCCSGNQAHSMIVPLELHLWSVTLHTGVQ